MSRLKQRSAHYALDWMQRQVIKSVDLVLFRGQRRVWPTIKPSITRADEKTRRNLWNIVNAFCNRGAMHLTGYRIDKVHDRLSVLQHYVGFSPVIDLTGTPRVALYFALKDANVGDECVVYSVEKEKVCVPGVVLSDHLFLALPFQEGGKQHRWLRQDGYSLGPEQWRYPDVIQDFDMLKLPGVNCMRFHKQLNDEALVKELGDLENVSNDPLAYKVRSNVKNIAKTFDNLTPGVQKILKASATVDPDVELALKIDRLIEKATNVGAQETLLSNLKNLKTSLQRGVWDTSFSVALDAIEKEL